VCVQRLFTGKYYGQDPTRKKVEVNIVGVFVCVQSCRRKVLPNRNIVVRMKFSKKKRSELEPYYIGARFC
jgi:hypothetical protein